MDISLAMKAPVLGQGLLSMDGARDEASATSASRKHCGLQRSYNEDKSQTEVVTLCNSGEKNLRGPCWLGSRFLTSGQWPYDLNPHDRGRGSGDGRRSRLWRPA